MLDEFSYKLEYMCEDQFHLHLFVSKGGGSPNIKFRPISFTPSLCKIIAKVLSNRLKDVIPGVTEGNQSA